MKILKKYKQFLNESVDNINQYLKESTFDNLPIEYKKGILPWMYESGKADWSIDTPIKDWVNDKNVDILIDDYSKEYGNELWLYGLVPTELVIKKIEQWVESEGDYDSFEQYHKIYNSTNKANHGESLFPIIVSDKNEEYIDDGWHRFHYYIKRGFTEIPIIKFKK